jgi:FAD dependent oxidoreductase TIGR03364
VLVVGAGIVGLAHATAALARGLTVTVIDRDTRAVGASVRNFGHCCVTAQSGELLELALVAREKWIAHAAAAGFFSVQSGALAIARTAIEMAVLDELSASREPGQVELIGAAKASAILRDGADPSILGGAILRDDLRVDPREAVASLAAWVSSQPGATMLWQTSFFGAANGLASTSRGDIQAERTIVCVGHDLDYLYPALAADREVERCALQMMRVEPPSGMVLRPAVLTGTSMLRYPAFAETAAAQELRTELTSERRDLLEIGANIMFTQRPNGTLIIGDSHRYAATVDAFQSEKTSTALLAECERILGVDRLRVKERWQGVYASSPRQPFLIEDVAPGVTVAIVTSGVGMTIAFGLAEKTLAALAG